MVNIPNVNGLSDSRRLEISLEERFFTDDNTIYDYEDIKSFSRAELGADYTDGKVAGIINKMINDTKLIRTNRGKYMLAAASNSVNIKEVVDEALTNAINEIQNNLAKVIAVELGDDDFKSLSNAREVVKLLQEKLVSFK